MRKDAGSSAVWVAPAKGGAHKPRAGAVQIDLRFTNPEQGSLAVVVAPVLRFQDVDIRIEELGPPEKLIGGFAPELFGSPLQVKCPYVIS